MEIMNLNTLYFTLPNSLLPCSLFTFIHLYITLYCGQTFIISIAGASNNGYLHLTGDALLRKGQRNLNTNFLPPPTWPQSGLSLLFPSVSFLLSHFHPTASPKFIFKDAFNITQLLPELIIIAHGFCYMT